MAYAREQVRAIIEQFIGDWLLKSKGWGPSEQCFVKVFFADEPGAPFPQGLTARDFLP